MPDASHPVADQFEDACQQHEAARLGTWTFLASELLFFGGLFTSYIVYRDAYPADFAAASQQTNVLLGTLNTALLLTSSWTMAMTVHAAQHDQNRSLIRNLLLTLGLALGFLVVKGFEYHEDVTKNLVPGPSFADTLPPRAELFFVLYWVMTGVHALHVLAGVGLLTMILFRAIRHHFSARYYTPVEMTGLYWHFVDLVWIILYPLLYLIGAAS